jgi:hypothetical protein
MTNDPKLTLRSQCILSAAEFARTDFLAIDKALMQLRLLAVGTGGVIASVVFTIFFTLKIDTPGSLTDVQVTVIASLAISLSFFYAVLALLYVNLSGRRQLLANYDELVLRPNLCELDVPPPLYTSHLDHETDRVTASSDVVSDPHGVVEWILRTVWSVQSFCIFILPSLIGIWAPALLPLVLWPKR